MDLRKITIIDKMNKEKELLELVKMGIIFKNENINKKNYKDIFADVKKNDIIIDCAYNINTVDMLKLCQEKGCHYINSNLDDWDYGTEESYKNMRRSTIYNRHKELFSVNDKFLKKNFNMIVSLGCNPGNVSIWMKKGLEKINEKYGYKYDSFAELARKLGVQVIHISEKDTQINDNPKKKDEYCNTWSSDGESYYDEILGTVELSYGTHEKKRIFKKSDVILYRDNFLVLNKLGINIYAQSVVPYYERYIGNVVKHDEVYTIGKTLEIRDKNNKIIYKPSVYFVYNPCDDANISKNELKENDYVYQTKYRLLTDEIVQGRDILGIAYFLENKEVYWIGSMLSIEEARKIFDDKMNKYVNATVVQVIAGYLSGIIHLIDLINEGKNNGLMIPDDLPHQKMFNIMRPFLGEFIFKKIDNFKLLKYDSSALANNLSTDEWQFENFLV